MARANDADKAERLNHARSLLQRFESLPDAVDRMVRDCSVSPRQAYRYLQQAGRLKQDVPVTEAKIAFTVKLSEALVERLRSYAGTRGLSLSDLVSRALEAFLPRRKKRGVNGPPGRRHTIQLEYRFDRLLSAKLEQVYGLLVPDKRWPIHTTAIQEKLNEQASRDLCTSVFRSAEGESDDRQSDGGPERIRRKSRLSGTGGMGVFEDDGFSGASLIRPGLEAMRDLAAQGQIETALVYAPQTA